MLRPCFMDSSSRSPGPHASDFDEDEGSTTAIFQQKMSDIFSSLATSAPHTTQGDADIASLLGDPPPPAPVAAPLTPATEAPLPTTTAPLPAIPSGPSSSRLGAPLPAAAPALARPTTRWITLVVVMLALIAAGAFVVLRLR